MSAVVPMFGQGGTTPYDRMLDTAAAGRITLRRSDGTAAGRWAMGMLRGPADVDDMAAIDGARGPLLDIGCGPGRMVRAAAERGIPTLGIDVSGSAVRATSSDGTFALRRSVFEQIPLEGRWRTVLLMDGNIGIGGDPLLLLRRSFELLSTGGEAIIEIDRHRDTNEQGLFTIGDDTGALSDPFPWARVGERALRRAALAAGFHRLLLECFGARLFVRAIRPATIETKTMASAQTQTPASAGR